MLCSCGCLIICCVYLLWCFNCSLAVFGGVFLCFFCAIYVVVGSLFVVVFFSCFFVFVCVWCVCAFLICVIWGCCLLLLCCFGCSIFWFLGVAFVYLL